MDINNGFILQYGYSWNPTFPIAFTNIVGIVGNSLVWGYCIAVDKLTNTNTAFDQWFSSNGGGKKDAIYWFAFGY